MNSYEKKLVQIKDLECFYINSNIFAYDIAPGNCLIDQWVRNHTDKKFDYNGKTIMVAPAAGFYSSKGTGLNQIRIAYVLKKESLINAVEILKQALKKYRD